MTGNGGSRCVPADKSLISRIKQKANQFNSRGPGKRYIKGNSEYYPNSENEASFAQLGSPIMGYTLVAVASFYQLNQGKYSPW
jgi:hypothetical protein